MNTYDVICPACGTVNHNLYLDETSGMMECEHCGQVISLKETAELKKIKVYISRQAARIRSEGPAAVTVMGS